MLLSSIQPYRLILGITHVWCVCVCACVCAHMRVSCVVKWMYGRTHLPQGERLSSLRERIQKLLDVPEKDMDKVHMKYLVHQHT